MKKILLYLLLFIHLSLINAQNLSIGDKFPLDSLGLVKSKSVKIIVFIPTLSYACRYSTMLTKSLNHYFIEGLCFDKRQKTPVEVILIVNDTAQNYLEIHPQAANMQVKFDPEGVFYKKLDLPISSDLNDNSLVFCLNKKGKIIFKDFEYRAQGEHLKPLETAIKKCLGISNPIAKNENQPKLKVGDIAPNIDLKNGQKIDSFLGKVLVLTFYPAAFSGEFPIPFEFISKEMTDSIIHKNGELPYGFRVKGVRNLKIGRNDHLMSCYIQLTTFETLKEAYNPDLKTIAISNSTEPLLDLWKKELEISSHNTLTLLNDKDGSIANTFNAYNKNG
jgi:peroxiredoxin